MFESVYHVACGLLGIVNINGFNFLVTIKSFGGRRAAIVRNRVPVYEV